MSFSVPATYNIKDVPFLLDNNVKDIYGSFGNMFLYSVKIKNELRKVKLKEIKSYVNLLHKKGITFSFTFNIPKYNLEAEAYNKFRKDILKIKKLGVDYMVIADINAIKPIRKIWPDVKFKISCVSRIKRIKEADAFYKLGIKEIILDPSVNKKINLLKSFVKEGYNITLLVNECCINNCPKRDKHYKYVSNKKKGEDIFQIWCASYKLLNQDEYYRSCWIRPEELIKYEKIGITSFKLSGRDFKDKWVKETIKAYNTKRYKDIGKILTGYYFNKDLKGYKFNIVRVLPNSVLWVFIKIFSVISTRKDLKILSTLNFFEFVQIINFLKKPSRNIGSELKIALEKVNKEAQKMINNTNI